MRRIISAMTVLLLSAAVSCCSEKEFTSQGLQHITVDGITVDITEGDAALEAALGDKFDIMAEWTFNPINDDPETILLYHCENIDRDGYMGRSYMIYDYQGLPSEHVTVYDHLPSNADFSEYKAAYEGLYFENVFDYNQLFGNNDSIVGIYQLDDRIITAEQGVAAMEADGYENGIHSYLLDKIVKGEAQELILMLNMFDDEECYYCALTYYLPK